MKRDGRWSADPARRELLSIYRNVDSLLAPYGCESTQECCHFAITGREPHPTQVELIEVFHAAKSASALPVKKRLPLALDTGRCPLLSDAGRCRIYASRPFGCRTYFCDRMTGPGKLPRDEIQAFSRQIADLSQKIFPRDPGPRSLVKALDGKGHS